MSVQRNDSASRPPDQTARNREVDRQARTDTKDAPPRERVDQFRSMMQQARGDLAGLQTDSGLDGALQGEGELQEGDMAQMASQEEATKTRQSLTDVVDEQDRGKIAGDFGGLHVRGGRRRVARHSMPAAPPRSGPAPSRRG